MKVSKFALNALQVNRGGCWNYYPEIARVAYRSRFTPGTRLSTLGFRTFFIVVRL